MSLISRPARTLSRVYHYDPKYKDFLFINIQSKRSLYFGTDWYDIFDQISNTASSRINSESSFVCCSITAVVAATLYLVARCCTQHCFAVYTHSILL